MPISRSSWVVFRWRRSESIQGRAGEGGLLNSSLRRTIGWLLGILAAIVLFGLAAWLFRQGSRPAPAPTEDACRFAGDLVPAAAQVAGEPPAPAATDLPVEALPTHPAGGAWRYGFGLATSADPLPWAEDLGAGWYLDWGTTARPADEQVEHWLMVRVAPDCTRPTPAEAASLAEERPGQTWIIGNEPDVIWQDNLTPESYAAAYHAYYTAIKRADPSAQIAMAGVAQPTALRLAYLDRVLETYQLTYGQTLPVDVWTVHNFVLREERDSWGAEIPPGFDEVDRGQLTEVSDHARLDLFEAQLRTFRAWMAQRGYRDTPLALTEFGILMPAEYGFPPEAVAGYLLATMDLLPKLKDPATGYPPDEDRLVQRWAWFSLSDPIFPVSDLADLPNGKLTQVGQAFRQSVEAWAGVP